jgi:hypothetical protein
MPPLCAARAAPACAAPCRAPARTPPAAAAAAAPQRARRAVARSSGAIGLSGGCSRARRAAAPPRAVAALEAPPAGEVRRVHDTQFASRPQRSRCAPPLLQAPAAGDAWISGTLQRCASSDAGAPRSWHEAAVRRGIHGALSRTFCCGLAGGGALAPLRAAGRAALAGARLPSARDEAFRFTDMSALAQARAHPPRPLMPHPPSP